MSDKKAYSSVMGAFTTAERLDMLELMQKVDPDNTVSEAEEIKELLGVVDDDMEIPEGDIEGEEELCLQHLKKLMPIEKNT